MVESQRMDIEMKTQFDITALIKKGKIQNELDLERALIADRKLRILAKEDPKLKALRKKLRNLIESYESQNWSSNSKISSKKIQESDVAATIAEEERQFTQKRKTLIREKLKKLNLTQQDFGMILGHKNKSYISELMNGISPFSLKDLVTINRLFGIDLEDLVPTFLPQPERLKVLKSIQKLENPKLKPNENDLALA